MSVIQNRGASTSDESNGSASGRASKPLRVEDCGNYERVYYRMLTPQRVARLQAFQRELALLCDRYRLDLIASQDACNMEVIERGFRYPEGFGYSASLDDQRSIAIDAEWWIERPKSRGTSHKPVRGTA